MRNDQTRRNVGPGPGGRLRRGLWLAAISGLVGIMVVAGGSAGARAEDEDDEPFEQKIIKDILGGLGVNVGRQNTIDYHERSPLVIPPTRDLPPPETTASVVNNPAWPINPETKKKKKKAASASLDQLPYAAGGYRKDESPVSEIKRDAVAGAGRVTTPNPNANADFGRPLTPAQMGEQPGGLFGLNFGSLLGYKNSEPAPFNGEPPRSSLVQPPEGYQTPSPQFPYGINPDNKKAYVAPNVMDRGTEVPH
jgi:hypothetical protein